MTASRWFSTWASVGASALALACRSRPPVEPPKPPPPAATAEPAPPPPPPPPKCESLEESCKAAADTVLELPEAGLSFTPPEGWAYAREPGLTVARFHEGTATLALTAAPTDDRKAVVEAVEKLAKRLEIEKLNTQSLRGRLNKADAELESGKLTIRLWEIDKRRQRGKAPQLKGKGQGTALVALAPARDGQVVVGVGFVVNPDPQSLAGAVMKSIQSLRSPP